MKRASMLVGTFLILSTVTAFAAPSEQDAFQAGVTAYEAGNYPTAITSWSSLVDRGPGRDIGGAVVHYDLGDAYFRNRELGRAIFQFRLAQLEMPRDPDLKYNLGYLRGKTEDKIEEKGIVRDGASLPWTLGEAWTLLAVVSVVFWGLGIAALFQPEMAWLRVRWLVLVLLLFAGLATAAKGVLQKPFGVVTVAESDVFSGAGKDNVLLFKLHEGAEFTVGDSGDPDWLQITLADGKKGWIRKQNVVF